MMVRYKVGQKVSLTSTGYLHSQYEHHGDVVGVVDEVVASKDWLNGITVPEYRVMLSDGRVIVVPEYSMRRV